MSDTSRPLMGNAQVSNPAVTIAATPIQGFNVDNPAEPEVNTDISAQDSATPGTPVHDWEKRYKDLQSWSSKTVAAKDQEINSLKSSAVPNSFQVPKTAEELSAFAKENPETYQFIQTIAYDMANTQTQALSTRLESTESKLNSNAADLAFAELHAAHPDFEKIDSSKEFHAWLPRQTAEVQGWVYNNTDNAQKLSMALSLFKQETKWGVHETNPAIPSNADIQGNLDASMAVTTNSTPGAASEGNPQYVWSESEIGAMRPEVFAKYEKDIDLALAEGRVMIGQ